MSLYAILAALGGLVVTIAGAFFAGSRSANRKRSADQSKAALDTYRKSTEAQDNASDLSDDAISDWLRERSRK